VWSKKYFFLTKKSNIKKNFLGKSLVKKQMLFRKKIFYFIFQKVKIKIKISKEI
jgi:hypothetical protein